MTVDTAVLLSSFVAAAVCIAVAAGMEWRDYKKRNRIGLHPNRDKHEEGGDF